MKSRGLKRNLRWIEAGLYLGGIALLGIFFYIRADSNRQAEEGIQAFQLALETEILVQDSETGDNRLATVEVPDQALWNQQRITEYEESLKLAGDPPLAILTIDNLGIQVPVFDGTDDLTLNRGIGRIAATATVDGIGNLGIAGHRDSFFRGLKDIAIGDSIELQTTRSTVNYEVSSIIIVDPSDVSVLNPTREKTMTLVTCYPFYFVGNAPKRYIVKATEIQSLLSN